MDKKSAKAFAQEWVDFWNSGDIDLILSHYAQDIEMYSPVIRDLMHIPEGYTKGIAALRAYFLEGLRKYPENKFQLQEVFLGVSSITIFFRGATKDLVAETLFFNKKGKVNKMLAQYLID